MKRFVFLLSGLLLGAGPLQALQLVPSYQFLELKPGQKLKVAYTLTNTENETITVTPQARDWFVYPKNKDFTFDKWLDFDDTVVELKPGESFTLNVTAKAPRQAVGELVGMVSFRTVTPSRPSLHFMMSGAIYVAIRGTEKIKGKVVAMSVMPRADKKTVGVGAMVENLGNVHLRPKGRFKIFNARNKLLINAELPKGQPVYPGRRRTFTGEVSGIELKPGKYKAQVILKDMDRLKEIKTKVQKFRVKDDGVVEFK